MAVTRWEPFRDFVSLREAMNGLLEDSFVRPGQTWNGIASPALRVPVDIYQTENELIVQASVPGVRPEDLQLHVLNGVFTLKGESKQQKEEGQNFLRQEVQYGSFERSFQLPVRVQAEKARASFENGILTVSLPKAEEAKPQQIKIQVGGPALEG